MSRGSPKIVVRVSAELLQQLDLDLATRNENTRHELWERSDWVRAAIREKLDHRRRSRGRTRKVKSLPTSLPEHGE